MKDIINALKEFPKLYFHAFSIIGIFYFIFRDLDLFAIPTGYRVYVNIGLMFCFTISIIDIIQQIVKLVKNKNLEKRNRKNLREILLALDNYEKDVLCKFYDENKNTVNLESQDGVILGLVHDNVLLKTSTFLGGLQPYRINSYLKSIIDPEQHLNLSAYQQVKEQNKRFYS